MNLNESFPFAPFEEKWDNLNDLFEASDKALVGIYNSNLIGVCLTNVIISMITSSTILMKHIEEKQKCKALDLCSFMKNIYRCVHKSIPERIDTSKETVGDIIRTGIQMVANNLPYASDYGVCGDYHLFKTYYYNQDLQTKPNEQSAEKFERLIRMNKECSVRDALRWHAILPDVFDLDPNQIKVRQTGNYNLFYYLEINMLSIEFKIGNLPGNQFDNL
ncbi:hypothetical protein SNEBB_006282 [Seison nebaliae]|nr:hypothetical protein SNEBB_006282 [Seison nebaliae]